MTSNTTAMGRAPERNEAAASLAWLTGALGLAGGARPGPVAEAWAEIRERMRRPYDPVLPPSAGWTSDPWLARGPGTWNPPEPLDEWPSYDVTSLVESFRATAVRTRPHRPPSVAQSGRGAAVGEFTRMRDTRTVPAEHVRAWLTSAVGPLLREVMLTPDDSPGDLADLAAERLSIPRQINLPVSWALANQFAERHLDLLYNLTTSADGRLSFRGAADIRTGQGEGWREHWAWLSRDLPLPEMREALRLAARLMRCDPVVEALRRTAGSDDPHLRALAPAVARRWLLTLKAMAWLEDATRETWTHLRPQDLACFAFNAAKPDWPRRAVGVSHRSGDAKAVLARTELWASGGCAIDATCVPSWETNTGMMWGLFSTTPAVVRLRSPRYQESVWCLREAELTRHLVERADFLAERWVLDVDLLDLRLLDDSYSTWTRPPREPFPSASGPRREPPAFPPPHEVWTPRPMPAWETAMLRAGAALRVINTIMAGADLTNRFVAQFLLGDTDFPGPAPMNSPGGWHDYRAIFRELQAVCDPGATAAAVRLPSGYSAEQMALDLEMLDRMPDLGDGAAALEDVLVAYEFLRTEWPCRAAGRRGAVLAIDCRPLSGERWTPDETLSLHRGLLAVRTPVPVWLIQSAGQEVERWPVAGDPPIFTEHVPGQFSWMRETALGRDEARSLFPTVSGLDLSPALRDRCARHG
ncbi:hypothetical protein [Sphaerisporangium fuscum]|uniref:hypothetical protein n=1 Tax=Sphaerisporangium fuscum TaxID=2835868 RepID=UPI001BDDB50E|nr:hypothetical protein [Sphaerisporangium fuscum]